MSGGGDMARNRFGGIDLDALRARTEGPAPALGPAPEARGPDAPTAETRVAEARGPVPAVRASLADARRNAVIEVDPAQISDPGGHDRIADDDAAFRALVESLRDHGQHVPVMLRPAQGALDRYEIVYGRRRIRAARELGRKVRAIVRDLDDAALLLTQGQENSVRLDPSFAEKARFAHLLVGRGYLGKFAAEAVNVHPSALSQMLSVVDGVTLPLLERIGAAHGTGRPRWQELAAAVGGDAGIAAALIAALDAAPEGERMATVFAALGRAQKAARAAVDTAEAGPRQRNRLSIKAGGRTVARVTAGETRLQISLDRRDDAGFTDWVAARAGALIAELHARYRAEQDTDPQPDGKEERG